MKTKAVRGLLVSAFALGVLEALAVPASASSCPDASACVIELNANNYATFNLTTHTDAAKGAVGAVRGMNGLVFGGINHLYQQWLWYAFGGARQSVDNLTLFSTDLQNNDGDIFGDPGKNEHLKVIYRAATFDIVLDYTLKPFDVLERVTVQRTCAECIVSGLQLINYADFDVGGTKNNDRVERLDALHVRQNDGTAESQTGLSLAPNHWELAEFDDTKSKLDTTTDDLSDSASPLGPGDVTWAFQWLVPDLTAVSPTFSLSKDKFIGELPEPASLGMLGLGLAVVGFWVRGRGRR